MEPVTNNNPQWIPVHQEDIRQKSLSQQVVGPPPTPTPCSSRWLQQTPAATTGKENASPWSSSYNKNKNYNNYNNLINLATNQQKRPPGRTNSGGNIIEMSSDHAKQFKGALCEIGAVLDQI